MNAENPHSTEPETQPSTTGRRVPVRALGLLAAAAISAGAVGTLAFADTASAEPGNGGLLGKLTAQIDDMTTSTDDWDDCPGCGLG